MGKGFAPSMRTWKSGTPMRMLVVAVMAIAACLLACGVLAGQAQAGELAPGTQLKAQSGAYSVWVGGTQVTYLNQNDVLGDGSGSVTYDPNTSTLTLNNAKIDWSCQWTALPNFTRNDGIVAVTGGTFTVNLIGTNTIAVPYRSSAKLSAAITCYSGEYAYQRGNLAITGTGKLTAKAAKAKNLSAGIDAAKLTISGNATVIAKGAAKKKSDSYGVFTTGKTTIKGKAKVTASGGTAAFAKAPAFKGYTPKVKAGSSAKKIKVSKKKPTKSVYTKYKYVSITKATASKKK